MSSTYVRTVFDLIYSMWFWCFYNFSVLEFNFSSYVRRRERERERERENRKNQITQARSLPPTNVFTNSAQLYHTQRYLDRLRNLFSPREEKKKDRSSEGTNRQGGHLCRFWKSHLVFPRFRLLMFCARLVPTSMYSRTKLKGYCMSRICRV